MTPVEVMRDGKWVREDGLQDIKRGDVFRLIGRNNERGNPHTAETDARRAKHPKRPEHEVWAVDTVYEPIGRR